MINLIKYIVPFFFLLLFAACSEDSFESVVAIDIPDLADKLVVNCIFQPDEGFVVNVSKSIGSLDNQQDVRTLTVDNASIELYEDGELLTNQFTYEDVSIYSNSSSYRYRTTETPKVGKEYRIKVSAPSFEIVEAVAQIPTLTPIANAYISNENYYDNVSDLTFVELTIEFQDDGAVDNFYYLNFYGDRNITRIAIDSLGNPILDSNGELTYTDTLVYNRLYASTFDPSFDELESFDDLDPEEDQRVYLYQEINTFDDALFNGDYKKVRVYFDTFYSGEFTEKLYIELGSLERSYYLYYRSKVLQGSTDDNPFAEPVTVFNNIENGFGIFTGFGKTVIEIDY